MLFYHFMKPMETTGEMDLAKYNTITYYNYL